MEISGAPLRHRRDVGPVTATARWRGGSLVDFHTGANATLALLELSQAIRSKCSREALPRGRTKLTAKTVADVEAGGEFSVEVTLGSNGRGPRAFYLVLSDDEELVALKKVVVGGSNCEASLAVEAPDEPGEWSLVLRAVFDGPRGFNASFDLPSITVGAKSLDAGAAEFVPGS